MQLYKKIAAGIIAGAAMFALAATASAAGGVAVDETNFPDEIFREYVSENIDTDKSGDLSLDEANYVTEINVDKKGISSLSGIEYFTALKNLNCAYNQLTSLDVSKNTALEYLDCGNNQLTSLDVGNNTELTYLQCGFNKITELDVSKNTKLENLYLLWNNLTNLDISKNTALTALLCNFNQLTSIDVSKNTALEYLDCHDNQLTSLDVSKNTALDYLDCSHNQLTSLDVSKNTRLWSLDCCYNQLTSLDVSNCSQLYRVYCYENIIKSIEMVKYLPETKVYLFLCKVMYQRVETIYGTTYYIGRDVPVLYDKILSEALSDYNFEEEGKKLLGYSDSETGTEPIDLTKIKNRDITLYALWEGEDYSTANYGDAQFTEELKPADILTEGTADEIKLTVTESDPAEEIQTQIKGKVADDTQLVYLDISLFKVVGTEETAVTETKTPVEIKITLPDELKKPADSKKPIRAYSIVRVHNGAVDIIEAEFDGTYLTFSTDKFSDYAIAYIDLGYGDVNGDGKINAKDVLAIRKSLVGSDAGVYYNAAGDVNADQKVNAKDVLKIRKYIVDETSGVLGQA